MNAPNSPPEVPAERIAFGVSEVIALTSLSKPTIFRHIKAGRLPAVMVGGRRLILRRDLEDFLQMRQAA